MAATFDLLTSLDESQRRFCEASVGNTRLLAPAGCGKTLSLLFRCAYLAEQARPQKQRFLIISFTRAAQEELSSRVNEDSRISGLRDQVNITTLNSWGFRRLKDVTAYPRLVTTKDDFHFTVKNALQPVWSNHERVKAAIEAKPNMVPKKIMDLLDGFKSIGFDHTRHTNLDTFLARNTELRNQGLGSMLDGIHDELTKLGILEKVTKKGTEQTKGGDREVYKAFYRFWRDATEHLIDSSTFTLEDQKYYAYLDERQKLEEGKLNQGIAKWDHVFVDEFQDINPLDLALIKAITERNRATLTIVGDDDQALFEWRGATPEYILDPQKYFGTPFLTYTLDTNYRSPKNIVERSQLLIAHNERRVKKDTRAFQTTEAEINVREVEDLEEGMNVVVAEVERARNEGSSPSRVAIIGRKKAQLIPYQIYFASKEIPFCAAEDLQVFMSKAFERLVKLLMIRVKVDERQMRSQIVDDTMELCSLIKRYPLSKADREELRRYLTSKIPLNTAVASEALFDYKGKLKGKADGSVSSTMAEAIGAFLKAPTVSDALLVMSERFEGLQIDLGKAEDDVFFNDPPFGQLAEYAERYREDFGAFIDDIDLAKQQLVYLPPYDDDDAGVCDDLYKRPLHLMTAIRAKGKEFDSVVLLDFNDTVWPNKNAKTPEQKEAERRVCYVAFTRAKKRITMIVADRLGRKEANPSPYLEELGLPLIPSARV
ncbi:hypothetical protein BH11ARM2_BH11ARM2_13550 [soil metagenome]